MYNSELIEQETACYENNPYDQCLDCPDIDGNCDGPNMLAMTPERWCEWCRRRKERLGYTNAYIAEHSGVSIGTVERLMRGEIKKDVMRSTVADISRVLVGSWGQYPCAKHIQSGPVTIQVPVDNPKNLARIDEQSEEMRNLHDIIKSMTFQHQAAVTSLEISSKRKVEYLKEIIERYELHNGRLRRWLALASVLAAVFALVIISAVIVDFFNGSAGFLWTE